MATAPAPLATDIDSSLDSFLAKQQQQQPTPSANVDASLDSFLAKNGQASQPAPKQPSTLETAYQYSGIPGLIEAGKGAIKHAARTATNIGLWGEAARTNPQWQQALQTTNAPQAVGGLAEDAAEFMAPSGVVGKGAKAIEAATAGMKGASIARVLGRAVLDGTSAGAVAGVRTGGDLAAARDAALGAGGASAVGGAVSQAVKSAGPKIAARYYQSALKPVPSMDEAARDAIVKTGLKEGLVLNSDVVANAQKRIDDINAQITQEIANRADAGATVDPEAVANYTDRSAARFANQVNPEADVNAVQGAKSEFLRNNSVEVPFTKVRPGSNESEGSFVPEGQDSTMSPQPIPLDKAQQMKQGTYTKLKGSYGEQASASREAQKDLARGLKDQIVAAFPEIANLNARESSLLALESSLERFVGREGNKQLIGLGTPMVLAGTHSIPLTMVKAALDFAPVKSRLAIALARAAQNPSAGTGIGQTVPALAGAATQGAQR